MGKNSAEAAGGLQRDWLLSLMRAGSRRAHSAGHCAGRDQMPERYLDAAASVGLSPRTLLTGYSTESVGVGASLYGEIRDIDDRLRLHFSRTSFSPPFLFLPGCPSPACRPRCRYGRRPRNLALCDALSVHAGMPGKLSFWVN